MKQEEHGIAFTTQFNEWVGRRHPIWYFITGVGLAVSVVWTVYQYVLLPEVRRSSDRAYDLQANENRQLRNERDDLKLSKERLRDSMQSTVGAYRDSLTLVRSFGQYLGDFEIPTTANPGNRYLNLYEPLLGKQLQVMSVEAGKHTASLDLVIDTCPPEPSLVEDRSECTHFHYSLPLSLHHYTPFTFGRLNITAYLEEIRDLSVVIKLYRPERMN